MRPWVSECERLSEWECFWDQASHKANLVQLKQNDINVYCWTNAVTNSVYISPTTKYLLHGPLARYVKLRLRMRWECRERFPATAGKQSKHASWHVRDALVVMHAEIDDLRFPLKSAAEENVRYWTSKYDYRTKQKMRKLGFSSVNLLLESNVWIHMFNSEYLVNKNQVFSQWTIKQTASFIQHSNARSQHDI